MAEINEKRKQEAYEAFLAMADDKKDIEEKFKKLSFREFTRYGSEELNLGCPGGWHKCPDGSCVPGDMTCD